MSLVNRLYPDIVRDVLTNLTQGVTMEVHTVSYDLKARPVVVPDVVLKRRPVRRVSYVAGFIPAAKEGDPPAPYTFSLNDYQLVPNPASNDPADLSVIRFSAFGKKPAPGTDITVNYYPRNTGPAVVTDLNVGSVVRTLLEAVSKELALLYTQLNSAYDSAFVETATGSSLERVVALLGYDRFRAGRATGTVTFSRRPGSPGAVTIPAGTPITDTSDKIRYQTVVDATMQAAESVVEVPVRGATDGTPPVDAGVLTVIQTALAGISAVTNERPTTRASDDESDQDLRSRVRGALTASNKGTVEAITNGLLQMPEVRDVKVIEMPNGVPGEISVSLSLADGPVAPPPSVLDKIEQLRPAGIRVLTGTTDSITLQANVALVLAGSSLPDKDIQQIHQSVQALLAREVAKKGVGEIVRVRPLVSAMLADQRIVDATVTLGVKGQAPSATGADFQPDAKAVPQLSAEDVSFAADAFDKPAAQAGQKINVNVTATIAATAIAGVPIDDVKTTITNNLKRFFANVKAGAVIDSAAILTAVRDDTKYSVDPLRLKVTLKSDQQFVQIAQGGPVFQVQPLQTFTVGTVEVTA